MCTFWVYVCCWSSSGKAASSSSVCLQVWYDADDYTAYTGGSRYSISTPLTKASLCDIALPSLLSLPPSLSLPLRLERLRVALFQLVRV